MGWISDTFFALLQRQQTIQTLKKVQKNNVKNRNITQYLPSEIEGFFDPNEKTGGYVISGGQNIYRIRAVNASCICAYHQKLPAVILHDSNNQLESTIQSTFVSTNNAYILNHNNPTYDPFVNLTGIEISNLIFDSTPRGFEIDQVGKHYINGIDTFIKNKGLTTSWDILSSCPHDELFNRLDAAVQKGKINNNVAQAIRNMLMQGQSERAKIENFINLLHSQGNFLLSNKNMRKKSVSIRKVVNDGGIICIDIQSTTNNALLSVIINEIQTCLAARQKLMLVIDNLSIDCNEHLEKFIKSRPTRCDLVLCSDDVYSMLGSNDSLFSSLVGIAQKSIVFSHRSGVTCTKWAEVFGYYDLDKISQNLGHNQNTFSINKDRDYRVSPQDLGKMNNEEVYILNGITNELAYTTLV